MIKDMSDSTKAMHAQIDFSESQSMLHSGFIAQEVEQACIDAGYPNTMVHIPANSNETYGLKYAEFVVPIVKAIQEQQVIIDSLKAMMDIFTGVDVKSTGASGHSSGRQVALSIPSTALLGNATPNPNEGYAEITYFIPANVTEAKMVFTDMLGQIIEEVTLDKGYGVLNISTSDIPHGVYHYTLTVDGNTIDSKKMIKN